MDQEKLTTTSAEQGQYLSVVGDTYRLVITGEQTDGAYAVIDMLVPPNGGPGPHAHPDFQESFYVLDGEVEVKTEHETYVARKGAFVNIPLGGIVHRFKNKSGEVAHLWCVVVPAGLEAMFQEIGQPVASGTFLPPPPMGPDDMKRIQAIAEKHGQKVYPPDYLGA
ncbi:cupin domain-containing protein [Fibrella sp. HMF5335]|uniref:Cupin domain-containing protein n=1 Tax=Fibrella rubiginis TaxID=2817060 RepID=A0A939GEE5_9BACT|nr:cupin domain-containing protein [Fibrella rubiginis]MBO0935196.1 cupin domain-containing protein [Fibrella rubiginis]